MQRSKQNIQRKRFDKHTLLGAAVISALLFITGVALGVNINEKKTAFLHDQINTLNGGLESFQLEFLLLDTIGENATCPLLSARINEVNKEAYELGQKVVSYEEASKFNDRPSLDLLKKDYYRTLIRYWLLNKKVGETCGHNTLNVIYFFANKCDKCDDQAIVLDYYKRTLNEEILIFALNGDVSDPFVEAIKKFYGIETYPSVVIDGSKFDGFLSKETLKERFCATYKELPICF